MRGAALASSNMENYEARIAGRACGRWRAGRAGRQLAAAPVVAGYLQMVMEGVFGLEPDGTVAPRIPASLVPLLFGERDRIALRLPEREVVLVRPAAIEGDLLVAERSSAMDRASRCAWCRSARRRALELFFVRRAAAFAPLSPDAPRPVQDAGGWRIDVPARINVCMSMAPCAPTHCRKRRACACRGEDTAMP